MPDGHLQQCRGDYQFTVAQMTCTSMLTSWGSISNTNVARMLIAAAAKTRRVPRRLCFTRSIAPQSYLSDVNDRWGCSLCGKNHDLCRLFLITADALQHEPSAAPTTPSTSATLPPPISSTPMSTIHPCCRILPLWLWLDYDPTMARPFVFIEWPKNSGLARWSCNQNIELPMSG